MKNFDNDNHGKMQPANTQHEKNKRNLIHFVASILPSQTGAHESKFDNDTIVSALKYHWTHESDNGIKSKNNLKLHKAHKDLENAKTALRALDNKMDFHNEDELEPAENEEREAKAREEECKAKLDSAKAARKKAWEEMSRKFYADTKEMLAEPEEKLRAAQADLHETTCILNHKMDKGKFLVM